MAALGFVLMLAFLSGVGGTAVAGFVVMLGAGGVAVRETFRSGRGGRRRRRPASRPLA